MDFEFYHIVALAIFGAGLVIGSGLGWFSHKAYLDWYWKIKIKRMQKKRGGYSGIVEGKMSKGGQNLHPSTSRPKTSPGSHK